MISRSLFYILITAAPLVFLSQVISCSPCLSAPTTPGAFRSKGAAVVAYSADSKEMIEGSIIGDLVVVKHQDGKVEELNITTLNAAAQNNSRYTWNLFLFFIGKDAWRGMRKMNTYDQHHGVKKLMGQANITLLINRNCTYKILNKVIYAPGQPPCTDEKTSPAANALWQQISDSIEHIAFKNMKIPEKTVESVTLEMIVGRDLEKFPRYPAGAIKEDYVLRDKKTGAMVRVCKKTK